MTILKSLLPRKLRKKIYRLGKSLYVDNPFPSIEASLDALKTWGFNPGHVIDIGAYHGEWTKMLKQRFPQASVLMVEAQTDKAEILGSVRRQFDDKVFISSSLLGPEDGKQVEFTEMETGSSVFEEQSPYQRNKTLREQITLDTLIKEYPDFARPDFLKLDVQGYELEVLKGASQLLANTEIVLMEASFIPVNQGAPLIDEVIAFMSGHGFRLLDFCSQIRRKDGALWQTDLLFIHNASKFIPPAELDESNWRRVKKDTPETSS